ncbi:MAG TPA: N-acetylmuramoyl-L-alanine amidase [Elusimicrobiota bacterium]|nr:N-acetylmuramoyl-L-alanine amidase [Elusimicrobiota bacterium]
MRKIGAAVLLAALLGAALVPAAVAGTETVAVLASGWPRAMRGREMGGQDYIALRDLASLGGGLVYYFAASGRILVRLPRATAQFVAGSAEAQINGRRISMSGKTRWHWGRAYVPASLLASPVFSAATEISLARRAVSAAPVASAADPPAVSTEAAAAPAPTQSAPAPAAAPTQATAAPAPVKSPEAALAAPAPPTHSRIRVVIDPGHGGKDSGAIGVRRLEEKNINLLAARQLAAIFRKNKKFDVIMTRDSDVFIPLSGRSAIANNDDADIFISLHCNSAPDTSRDDFEIYSMSDHATDPEAERLAEYENSVVKLEGKPSQGTQAQLLLDEMGETEFYNDGAKLAAFVEREADKRFPGLDGDARKADFYVLRGTHAPAILVEMDYINNRRGARRLTSRSFRKKLLTCVYKGVLDYLKAEGPQP